MSTNVIQRPISDSSHLERERIASSTISLQSTVGPNGIIIPNLNEIERINKRDFCSSQEQQTHHHRHDRECGCISDKNNIVEWNGTFDTDTCTEAMSEDDGSKSLPYSPGSHKSRAKKRRVEVDLHVISDHEDDYNDEDDDRKEMKCFVFRCPFFWHPFGKTCGFQLLDGTPKLLSNKAAFSFLGEDETEENIAAVTDNIDETYKTPSSSSSTTEELCVPNISDEEHLDESSTKGVFTAMAVELRSLGSRQEQDGDLQAATKSFEEALKLIKTNTQAHGEKLEQSDVVAIARMWHQLGIIHWKRGMYSDALTYLKSTLEAYQHYEGKTEDDEKSSATSCSGHLYSLEICDTLRSIGKVHLSKGQYENAMCFFKKSLTLGKQHHVVQLNKCDQNRLDPYVAAVSAGVARSMVCVAMVHDATGNYRKAMKLCQKGLYIQKSTPQESSELNVATTLNCLGNIHEKIGRYDEAMQCYSEALCTYRAKLLSDFHVFAGGLVVDISVSLSNMGMIHRLRGDYNEALRAFEEALELLSTSGIGREHRNVASIMFNIGHIHATTAIFHNLKINHQLIDREGEYCKKTLDLSMEFYRKALKIQRTTLGDKHIDLAITIDGMGDVYEKRRQYDKALLSYRKALDVRKAALGEHHIYVAITMHQLGKYFVRRKDHLAAMKCLTDTLRLYKLHRMGNAHPRVKEISHNLEIAWAHL